MSHRAVDFAEVGAQVRLGPAGGWTILHHEMDAKVGGQLAQLASRMLDGFAKKRADQFLSKCQQVAGPSGSDASVGAPEEGVRTGWFGRRNKVRQDRAIWGSARETARPARRVIAIRPGP
ncbi:SRPBCC domain-containing protein [Sulfitobacter sp. THAF37]|uniref:SRPBCC domain-containing protein n=1 Tax=Sulfitobacter sp. THAF37 TaxID=2587855 RepID=UPI0012697D06